MRKLPLSGALSPGQEIEATKGFTLVELIVSITIIAILGTIAFISLQSYSANARDSTRISDLSAMKTSLELFQLDAGKYPDPTEGFIVTYSGSEVWTQGTFGNTTFTNISKLDKIPTDPLTEKEYTYSVTKTRQEYQFAGIVEGDEISLNSTIGQSNAGDLIATALVTGTYNGQMLKTQNGINCNILSLPSIISSEPNTTTDLTVILDNESLVYNGYKNLPTNYISSKYKTDGGFMFTSNKIVVYDDSASCAPLYNPDDNSARIELITNLQEAYSETIIENEDGITGLVNIDLTDTGSLNIISSTLINNNFGGKLPISNTKINIITDNEGNENNFDIFCSGIVGDITSRANHMGYEYPSFDLCINQKELLLNTPINSSINIGDREVYGMILEQGSYKIGTYDNVGGENFVDTVIFLYDSNGNIITYNDYVGENNYYSEITFNITVPGVYYLGVMGYNDYAEFDYGIALIEFDPTILNCSGTLMSEEVNWNPSYNLCAHPINIIYEGASKNLPISGPNYTDDGYDVYRAYFETGNNYILHGTSSEESNIYNFFYAPTGNNPDITVFDSNGNYIENINILTFIPPSNGIYFIVMDYGYEYELSYNFDLPNADTIRGTTLSGPSRFVDYNLKNSLSKLYTYVTDINGETNPYNNEIESGVTASGDGWGSRRIKFSLPAGIKYGDIRIQSIESPTGNEPKFDLSNAILYYGIYDSVSGEIRNSSANGYIEIDTDYFFPDDFRVYFTVKELEYVGTGEEGGGD